MVTETNSQGVLDTKAESMLRELFKADMTCVRPGVWKFGDGESALWAVYLPDAGPTRKEEGEPPEPARPSRRQWTDDACRCRNPLSRRTGSTRAKNNSGRDLVD